MRAPQLPVAERAGHAITTSAATIGTVPGARQSVRVVTGSLRASQCDNGRFQNGPLMRFVILVAFILIIGSLASALFFMMRDRGRTPNMMRSLMLRVGFSVALFLFILFSHWMGWIQSTASIRRPDRHPREKAPPRFLPRRFAATHAAEAARPYSQ
jgi:hypothetical protein